MTFSDHLMALYTLLDSMLKFLFKKFLKNCAIIYCQQNSSFLFLSLLYKLTFSENCPIYFMTKYFNIFNVFLPNFYKIKFYHCSALVSTSAFALFRIQFFSLCLFCHANCKFMCHNFLHILIHYY